MSHTDWDSTQFADAEAAGFNPYAGPNGRFETPPARPSHRPASNRFGQPAPVRFWDLDTAGRDAF